VGPTVSPGSSAVDDTGGLGPVVEAGFETNLWRWELPAPQRFAPPIIFFLNVPGFAFWTGDISRRPRELRGSSWQKLVSGISLAGYWQSWTRCYKMWVENRVGWADEGLVSDSIPETPAGPSSDGCNIGPCFCGDIMPGVRGKGKAWGLGTRRILFPRGAESGSGGRWGQGPRRSCGAGGSC